MHKHNALFNPQALDTSLVHVLFLAFSVLPLRLPAGRSLLPHMQAYQPMCLIWSELKWWAPGASECRLHKSPLLMEPLEITYIKWVEISAWAWRTGHEATLDADGPFRCFLLFLTTLMFKLLWPQITGTRDANLPPQQSNMGWMGWMQFYAWLQGFEVR